MDNDLCKRTACLWRQGMSIKHMYCSYYWSGEMPLTGEYKCFMCGKLHPNQMRRVYPVIEGGYVFIN